ncbi:MAG: hypothetical protein AB7L66_03840 [Gemmatimonadales bacterium]
MPAPFREEPRRGGIRRYVRKALRIPWNLLALFGGLVGAALSPWPDALIPLVVAGEVAFIGGLVSIKRFRDAVDAEDAAKRREAGTAGQLPNSALTEALAALPQEARIRFHKIRLRCIEMQQLATGAAGGKGLSPIGGGDDLRRGSLDRLLWIFLRLLVSQESLRRFLRSTSDVQLTERVSDLDQQLKRAEAEGDERLITSLKDSVALAHLRLDNYRKADKNAQYVMVELDRIESKIQTLTEMMVNRQDPDLLTSQVDQAAQSMTDTESAIKELQTITGMADQLVEPPPILDADLGGVLKSEA